MGSRSECIIKDLSSPMDRLWWICGVGWGTFESRGAHSCGHAHSVRTMRAALRHVRRLIELGATKVGVVRCGFDGVKMFEFTNPAAFKDFNKKRPE